MYHECITYESLGMCKCGIKSNIRKRNQCKSMREEQKGDYESARGKERDKLWLQAIILTHGCQEDCQLLALLTPASRSIQYVY